MIITCKISMLVKALGRSRAEELSPEIRHREEHQRVPVEMIKLTADEQEQIYTAAKVENKPLARQISAWWDLRASPDGKIIANARDCETALISYIVNTPHKLLFERSDDNQMLPWYAKKVTYHPAVKHVERSSGKVWWSPPYVTASLVAFKDESIVTQTITYQAGDKDGDGGDFGIYTISQMLQRDGFFSAQEKTYDRYLEELAKFHTIYLKTGAQFLGEGRCYGESDDSWGGSFRRRDDYDYGRRRKKKSSSFGIVSLTREGNPSRVVMDWYGDKNKEDDEEETKVDAGTTDGSFWLTYDVLAGKEVPAKPQEKAQAKPISSKDDLTEDEEEEEEEIGEDEEGNKLETPIILPVHPYVQVFDFESDSFVRCHVNCLTEYKFTDLAEKLVLPDTTKRLVSILIGSAKSTAKEDIVKGKAGGVIVMSTGLPGVGKTLTAEVFAEEMKIPIYMVQCSQLGTSSEELEEALKKILKRAVRWNALLLLDEADVYTRARGDDIQQNAIVGVFLRLLERFRGILFMTSNRATEIDDAILSRCIAHIKYELPTPDNLKRIFLVLADNYNVFLSPGDAERLAKEFPSISGRNVKNLMKLSLAVANEGGNKDLSALPKGAVVDLIREVSQFVDFPAEHYAKKKK